MEIRPITTIDEAQQVIQVELAAWQMDPIDATPAHVLITIAKNGGALLGAYDGGRLVGFSLGWLGTVDDGRPASAHLKLVSHMTGVLPAYRDQRVGCRLKLAQREWALERGLELVTWTYDPLESRNANLNLRRLGATCNTYLRDVYGEMADRMNEGLASDRFRVDWRIATTHVRERLAGAHTLAHPPADAQLLNPAASGPGHGFRYPAEPTAAPAGPRLLVEIPADMQAIRRADMGLAAAWRSHTRAVFEGAFAAGYRATDFIFQRGAMPPRSFYLLELFVAER